jgi:uncharacterized protein (TIGR02466 family)
MVTISENIFPTKVVRTIDDKFSTYRDDLILWIEESVKRSTGETVSNRHGYQSKKNISDNEEFSSYLKKYICPLFEKVFKEYYVNKNFLNHELAYDLANCWFNVNYPGSYNVVHNHPGASLAAVYYLKVPKKSGNLIFRNPRSFCDYYLVDSLSYEIEPKEGELIFFPASLDHEVQENLSKETRISIAFNFKVYSVLKK